MTRKDYVKIAETLASCKPHSDKSLSYAYDTWLEVCSKMACTLSYDNPRFDRERFMSACGVAEPRAPWHVECQDCTLTYDDKNERRPRICGNCASKHIHVTGANEGDSGSENTISMLRGGQ